MCSVAYHHSLQLILQELNSPGNGSTSNTSINMNYMSKKNGVLKLTHSEIKQCQNKACFRRKLV